MELCSLHACHVYQVNDSMALNLDFSQKLLPDVSPCLTKFNGFEDIFSVEEMCVFELISVY